MTELTVRQLDVLKLAADGYGVKMSAQALGLSPETVKDHRAGLMAALRAADMPHAVSLAYRAGVLRVEVAA
jgi:DNA-binding NarL/FixJ family response regulator